MYRIAGLPIAVWTLLNGSGNDATDPLHALFVERYWNPDGFEDWIELVVGLVGWPILILLALAWYTWQNGMVIRRRYGKRILTQIAEQLSLYFSAGILPP